MTTQRRRQAAPGHTAGDELRDLAAFASDSKAQADFSLDEISDFMRYPKRTPKPPSKTAAGFCWLWVAIPSPNVMAVSAAISYPEGIQEISRILSVAIFPD
jgi:hypothetical protein